jgi:hypothetical protein
MLPREMPIYDAVCVGRPVDESTGYKMEGQALLKFGVIKLHRLNFPKLLS